ncbi:MAG: hypothetical protein ACKODX_03560 [Gemmata sp.]
MRLVALMLLALAPACAPAQDDAPALKLPAEVKAAPATIVEVRAETAGRVVEWVALTPGLSLRPTDGGRVLLFSGPPGRYELLAYTAAGAVPSKPARVLVVIAGPVPEPPVPPRPDALTEKVKKALEGDPEPDPARRAKLAKALAALYRELAKEAAEAPSPAEFRRVAKEAARSMVGDGALTGVRQVVGAEVALLLPTDAAFTAAQRAAVARLFDHLATILEGL